MRSEVRKIKLLFSTPEKVLTRSYGEVLTPNFINKKTNKPTLNGLFCPRIFGSKNIHECLCEMPLAENLSYCKVCGTELGIGLIEARARFGHLQLATPTINMLVYKSIKTILSSVLNRPTKEIEDIIACKLHLTNNKFGQYQK